MTTTTSPRRNPFAVLLAALTGSFRHWRIFLLAWLCGLVAASFLAWPVSGLFNRALGSNPDAERIVSSQDIAPIADAVMGLGGGNDISGLVAIGQGLALALLLAVLLTPWLTGMLVASLRRGRALGFGELWLGGWQEYGRQFRLLLVALIPLAVAGGIAFAIGAWARHGEETRILQSVGEQRMEVAKWIAVIVWLLAWSSVEAGRAAFAADPGLRSALRAWLRGLRLMLRRPLSVLLIVIATAAIGGGLALLLQQPALRSAGASGVMIWLLAQLAVLAIWWARTARMTALAAISPLPAPPAVAAPVTPAANIAPPATAEPASA